MKQIHKILTLLLMLFMLLPTIGMAAVELEENVPAAGPAAGATVDYMFVATRDGVLSLTHTFTGAAWGTISVNHQNHPLSSSVFVNEGDVALIAVTCEDDNTGNTLTVSLSEVEPGMTIQTAKELAEGDNNIPAMKSGDIARWYRFSVPAQMRGKLLFTGYPVLEAYIGADLADQLGSANPVDYINTSNEEVTIYVKLTSTNSTPLTANLSYSAPVADLSTFNALAFSVAEGGLLPIGDAITITFPNRMGGDDDDVVNVNYYIFNVVGNAPNGAPINLGGDTMATGTLSGVDINYDLAKGHKYQLKIQSVQCGNHFAPSAEEPMLSNDAVIFTVTAESGIEIISTDTHSTPIYNISGQLTDANQKGIVISGGKKIIR